MTTCIDYSCHECGADVRTCGMCGCSVDTHSRGGACGNVACACDELVDVQIPDPVLPPLPPSRWASPPERDEDGDDYRYYCRICNPRSR